MLPLKLTAWRKSQLSLNSKKLEELLSFNFQDDFLHHTELQVRSLLYKHIILIQLNIIDDMHITRAKVGNFIKKEVMLVSMNKRFYIGSINKCIELDLARREIVTVRRLRSDALSCQLVSGARKLCKP